MKRKRFAVDGYPISILINHTQQINSKCMATNEIEKGCGLSTGAVLASNQKRRRVTSDSTSRIDSVCYPRYSLQKFRWVLKAPRRVFFEKLLEQSNDRLRHLVQLSNRQGCMQVPVHQLGGCASEWRLPSQHFPECRAQRVEVRADVHLHSRELLGASKIRGPDKAPRH